MSPCALVMAGGRSERMRADGCQTHKALRTICGKSLVQRNLEYLFRYNFKRVFIAVNQAETSLLRGIDCLQPFAAKHDACLTVIKENRSLGTIGAAGLLSEVCQDVLVVNVDNLTTLDLLAFSDYHLHSEAALSVACHYEPFQIPFGQLEITESRVVAYKEKPTFPVMISSGIYALNRSAMAFIPPEEKIHAPDLINSLIAAGKPVGCYQHRASWIDINDEAALARAETLMSGDFSKASVSA